MLMLMWCCRFPGADRGPGALPDWLPDEAAVGEQGSRGEPGTAILKVWPGADRLVQQAGATCEITLIPDLFFFFKVYLSGKSSLSCSYSYMGQSVGDWAAPPCSWGSNDLPVAPERGINYTVRLQPWTSDFRSIYLWAKSGSWQLTIF